MIYVLLVIAFLRLNKTSCIMKAIKNRVQLMGYLGADPEIKIFEKTKKLANIRLAVNEGRLINKSYTDKNLVKRFSTDIHLSEILILTKKKELV